MKIKLCKNENKKVLYSEQNSKFGKYKYAAKKLNDNNNNTNIQTQNNKAILSINNKWLKQKGYNCRYNSFTTIFYFTISSFITNLNDNC